ncbi:MAG: DUF447 family protein [Gammaproteobacteria bacterium]|nr:DUF447 family protein [Gammaproteobacteria bacterium]
MILETVVTSRDSAGRVHLAPMGIQRDGIRVEIAPFRPSTTLDNLLATGHAAANMVDDVRVFAGCLTGRADWPLTATTVVTGARLRDALAHVELEVERRVDDAERPRFHCRVVHEETHGAFKGFNRAQAAVIEAAILVSRLRWLPADKVDREMAYLQIAVDKTAGEREREAWEWLQSRITACRADAERCA